MPEIDFELPHTDQDINGILVSYWPTVGLYTCDVCGESVQSYVRLSKTSDNNKVARCCNLCAKDVIRRWSKS